MPLSDILSFSYGDYEFDPRPLITINKEYNKTAANTGVATKYVLTLNGTLIPDTGRLTDEAFGGINVLFNRADTISGMRKAFETDFNLLFLGCTGNPPPKVPIISGYPKVMGIEFSPKGDNYVQQAEYTINLELPTLVGTGFEPIGVSGGHGDISAYGLTSVSDEFTVEFLEERAGGKVDITDFGNIPSVFSVQRTLSAQGDTLGTGGTPVDAWQRAKNWVTSQLTDDLDQGFPPEATGISGLMCFGTGMTFLNQFRNVSVNKTEGTCNATCSFIAASGTSYEDLDVSIDRSVDNPYTTININGTINGMANLSGMYDQCGDEVDAPEAQTIKFNNALSGWNIASGLVYSRAQAVYNSLDWGTKMGDYLRRNPKGALNSGAMTESLGYNILGGTITYNYTYDDRPYNCYTGALTETINITENNPNDIFASLTVIGRRTGPLLQAISTSGATTRDLSIDALLPVQTGCLLDASFLNTPTVYDDLITGYSGMLGTKFDQIFINSQSKTWEPKMGRFTANVSYTVGKC